MTVRLEPGPRSLGVQSLGGGGLGGGLSPRLNPLHHGSKSSGGLIKSSTALLGSRSSPALRYPPPRRLHPPRPARVSYSPPSASSATEGEGPGARDTPIPPRAASPESYYPSTGEGPGATGHGPPGTGGQGPGSAAEVPSTALFTPPTNAAQRPPATSCLPPLVPFNLSTG